MYRVFSKSHPEKECVGYGFCEEEAMDIAEFLEIETGTGDAVVIDEKGNNIPVVYNDWQATLKAHESDPDM